MLYNYGNGDTGKKTAIFNNTDRRTIKMGAYVTAIDIYALRLVTVFDKTVV